MLFKALNNGLYQIQAYIQLCLTQAFIVVKVTPKGFTLHIEPPYIHIYSLLAKRRDLKPRSRCQIHLALNESTDPPTPQDLCMCRFMITLASCFAMGQSPLLMCEGIFIQDILERQGLVWHKAPHFENVPILGLYPTQCTNLALDTEIFLLGMSPPRGFSLQYQALDTQIF